MKKIISLILVALMLIANIFCVISCKHECSWNDGEITTKPTQEADGIKTFTCTECEKTREEAVAFTGLSEEEWNEVICEEAFNNVTFTEEAVVSYPGVTVVTKATTKFTDDKVYVSITVVGQTNSQTLTGLQATNAKKQSIEQTLTMLRHSDYEYDAENKVYVLVGELTIPSLNTTADSATARFENGRLVEFSYTCKVVSQGITMDATTTTIISDYGTTTVD